jgi:hypothetical protein
MVELSVKAGKKRNSNITDVLTVTQKKWLRKQM